jgi:hypothetical protein
MFLRKEKFTPGILFDVIMFNMWVRTEKRSKHYLHREQMEIFLYIFHGC